ncbi:MAG: hypothetical protein Q4B31_05220 [Clostridia bacterium]|nr:hypothetical protein [Clostridia bacterium]
MKIFKLMNARSKQVTASILIVCLMLTMVPLSAFTAFAVTPSAEVAAIGDETYASLSEAVTNASVGDTIVMLADDSTAQEIRIYKNLTIDLMGFDLTGTRFQITGGNVVIRDSLGTGVINETHATGIYAMEDTSFSYRTRVCSTISIHGNANVSLSNITVHYGEGDLRKAIYLGGSSASLTINGGSYYGFDSSGGNAIYFYDDEGSTLTINDGYFYGSECISVNEGNDILSQLHLVKAHLVSKNGPFWIQYGYGTITDKEKIEDFIDTDISQIVYTNPSATKPYLDIYVTSNTLTVSPGFTASENGSTDERSPAEVELKDGSVTLMPQIIGGTDNNYTYKWYKDSGIISGATDSTYIATEAGNYSVTVSDSEGASITLYWTVIDPPHTHDNITFDKEWSVKTYNIPAGNYYLTEDFTAKDFFAVESGTEVNLCLNGHTLDLARRYIEVEVGGTLNIYDCGTDGIITTSLSNNINGTIENYGTVNLYGGKIENTSTYMYAIAFFNKESAVFNMYGGTLTTALDEYNDSNYVLENYGEINISGGKITGKTNGIFNNGNGTLKITGGTITGSSYGIYNYGTGTVDVSGGKVEATDSSYGYGINNYDDGTIKVSGGEIIGANHGMYISDGTIEISGGTVKGTNSYGIYGGRGNIYLSGTPEISGSEDIYRYGCKIYAHANGDVNDAYEGNLITIEILNYFTDGVVVYEVNDNNAEKFSLAENCTQTLVRVGDNLIVDGTAPTGEINIKNNPWKAFFYNASFGMFCKDYVEITITAEDTESGVAKIEYYLSDTVIDGTAVKNVSAWAEYDGGNKPSLTANEKKFVYAKITDNAGNVTYLSVDGGIVVFKDTEITTGEYEYTLTTKTDIVTNIKPGSNTVNMIDICEPGGNAGDMLDYFINPDGFIVLKGESLENFTKDWYAGAYTITIVYNALGEEYADGTSLGDKITDTVITLTVHKADGKVEILSDISKTYDGVKADAPTFQKLGTGEVIIEYKVKDADDSTYTTTAPKNAGDYTVRVTVASDNTYKEAFDTADFTIAKATPTGIVWPTGLSADVDGRKLSSVDLSSYTNGGLGSFVWENGDTAVKYDSNAYDMTYTPNDTGNYHTVSQKVAVIGNDVTAPTGTMTIDNNSWNTFWNNVTFGLFFKETQMVTVTSGDTESGVAKTEYFLSDKKLSENEVKDITDWTAFSSSFDIDPNNKYVVYVRITDNAGNAAIINSDGVVLDNILPVLSGIENDKTYYQEVEVMVTDTNLDKVTVNDEKVTVTDGKFKLTAHDEEQKVKAFDKAGNVSTEITVTVEAEHTFVWGEWYDNQDETHSKEAECICGADLKITAPKDEDVVVDGLEEESVSQGKDLKLIVETNIENIDDEAMEAIRKELGKGITAEYIDITVKDVIGDVEIADTTQVLEIPLAFDFTDKLNIIVYRNHGGQVAALEELETRPFEHFEDGTYYLDRENDLIYIYSNKFSTYGVTYHKHEFTHVLKKDATKEADGNIEYWYCEGCDKYFTDADGKNEISKEETIVKYVASPITGDLNNLWIWILCCGISMSVLIVKGVMMYKRNKKRIRARD